MTKRQRWFDRRWGGPLQLAKDQRIENPILQRVKDSQMNDLYNEIRMIDG